MNEETARFLVDLLSVLNEGHYLSRNKFVYTVEINDDKECVLFELEFRNGNKKYSDVALFFYDIDFNHGEFIDELKELISKGSKIII